MKITNKSERFHCIVCGRMVCTHQASAKVARSFNAGNSHSTRTASPLWEEIDGYMYPIGPRGER